MIVNEAQRKHVIILEWLKSRLKVVGIKVVHYCNYILGWP
jgi:hypothetical protein